jgi:hypothetical protein
MLEPPPVADRDEELSEGLVVFLIDVSGSMCVTQELPKGFGLFQVNYLCS